jgi:hypothetical protein
LQFLVVKTTNPKSVLALRRHDKVPTRNQGQTMNNTKKLLCGGAFYLVGILLAIFISTTNDAPDIVAFAPNSSFQNIVSNIFMGGLAGLILAFILAVLSVGAYIVAISLPAILGLSK